MINNKYLKLLRSKNVRDNFIYEAISKRIVDSLDLIKVPFLNILEYGVNDNVVNNYLSNKFPKSNIISSDIAINNISNYKKSKFLKINIEKLQLTNEYYNLIYSNFFLQLSNDFEETLNILHSSLKSNGFFIATIPDIDNAYQLVNSMYKTDLHLYNGAYQRTNPTKNVEVIFSYLKKFNFDIPTINSEDIIIKYDSFENLLKDIKNTKLSYCYYDKKNNFENKNYFNLLEEEYKNNYFDGKYTLNIKFNMISAWKK